jgi:hypothetical protein
MSNHKFKLGLTVFLERTSLNRDAAPGAHEVTRQLPREKRRVRVSDQKFGRAHARVVRESELSRE